MKLFERISHNKTTEEECFCHSFQITSVVTALLAILCFVGAVSFFVHATESGSAISLGVLFGVVSFCSIFIFLVLLPTGGKCENCASRFTDWWHEVKKTSYIPIGAYMLEGGLSILVTHCRLCGYNKKEKSIYLFIHH